MKLMDKDGKILGKVHILDLLILMMVLAVILGAISKFSSGNLISFTNRADQVEVLYTVITTPYREAYFTSLHVGDQLAEDKKFLEGEIVSVDVESFTAFEVDNHGNMVVGTHPFNKRATVTVRATLDYKAPVYTLGKQEIREGAIIFLTTKTANLSAVVVGFEIVE